MQQVPAFGIGTVAIELREAGDAPYVGRHIEVLLKQLSGGNHLAQDRSRTKQLYSRSLLLSGLGLLEQVHPLQYSRLDALGQRGMSVVLVHDGDVVIDIFLFLEHTAQAVLNDDRQLIGEGGVISHAVGNDARQDVAMAILMLQPLAGERRAPGRAADQEPARPHVARRPGQIADALEAKHRVEDVERNHTDVVVAVRGAGCHPRGKRTGLTDALLQHLSLDVLAVIHQLIGVLWLVQLAYRGVDAELAEQSFHTEGARLIRHDRYHVLADFLVARERREDTHEGHRR